MRNMKPFNFKVLASASMLLFAVSSLRAASESIFPGTVVPDAEYYDAASWELGTIFSSYAPGQITQVRVFSLPDETGGHNVSIWQNSPETLLFSTNWSFGGDNAWITLPIPALRIQADVEYTISISTTAAGAYPDNSHYFDNAGDDGQHLSYPQGAGVFNATLGSRPTGAYNNSAYLRDVVFQSDPFPFIGVQGNGLAIPSGDVAPRLGDGTQFGGVKLGSTESRTFTVLNSGTSNLVFSGASAVTIAGPQSGDYTVTTPPVSPVAPGGSTTFTVQFAPSAPGVRDATVSIASNARPAYQFAIEGIGMSSGNLIIGNTSEGNATGEIDNRTTSGITGNRYLALRNMSVTAIHAKVLAPAGATANFECAIYADASDTNGLAGQFLQGTAAVANPTNGWQTFALTQPVNLGAGSNYWLVIWSDTIGALVYGDVGGVAGQDLEAYGGAWPSPMSLAAAFGPAMTYSIYAEGVPLGDTGPEMYVKGGINAVADGATNVSIANGTDFGSAMLDGAARVQTFTILNVGQGSLALTGAPIATVVGPQASDFVVTTQPAGSVASGGSTTFTLTFTPSVAGIRAATVVVPHADSPTNAYQFAIQGEGLNDPGADVLGHDGIGADSRPDAAMNITGNRFMAAADLQIAVVQAKVVVLSGGNFACAVYADNNGFPGRLLRSSPAVANATNGWNAFPLGSPLNVTAGTFYWLLIWTDTTGNALDTDPGGTAYAGNSSYSWGALNGQWPDPIILSPITSETRTYCIYAEGLPISPAPGAQMSLRGNGKLILFGDTAPATLDGSDFGSVAAGKGTSDHTFTIQNLGSAPLQLTGAPPVAITGPEASDFSVTSPPTSPVAPGGSTTFTVRFSPSVSGLRAATVSIANNDIDPDKNPYQFAVRGAGFVVGRESLFPDSEVGSDVDNDGTQYDLGTIFSSAVGGAVTQLRVFSVAGDLGPHTAWIWNSDGSALAGPYTWDFGVVNAWIYLDVPPVAIQAGNQYTVDITTGQGPMHDYANEPAVLSSGGGNGLDLSYPPSAGVFVNPNGGGQPPLNVLPTQSWNGSSYLRDVVFVPAGTAASFPDMDVLGNNTLIQDGYSSPSNTNNTDFGQATAGSGSVDLAFVITNAGAAPLNLTATPKVAITGPQAGDFVVLAQPSTPISPGGSSTVTIRFAPLAAGVRNAIVSIGNDDKNPFYFSIRGTGTVAPRITAMAADLSGGNFTLQWVAQGQPIKVFRAPAVTGPFSLIGTVQLGNSFTDVGILKTNASAFYRIGY